MSVELKAPTPAMPFLLDLLTPLVAQPAAAALAASHHEGKMLMSGKTLAACAGVGAARNCRTKSTESPGGMISKTRPSSPG